MSHSVEEILPWVKIVVKNIQKDQKIQSMEKQKIKENQGWFGGWWGGQKSADELVTAQDRESWSKLFEENFSEEALNMPSVIRPPEYVWFNLEFRMQGGSIQLSSKTQKGNEEGIKVRLYCVK
jgi:vacuolar protein sorting-associated protein 13A/C